jgi:hypothetical protein
VRAIVLVAEAARVAHAAPVDVELARDAITLTPRRFDLA